MITYLLFHEVAHTEDGLGLVSILTCIGLCTLMLALLIPTVSTRQRLQRPIVYALSFGARKEFLFLYSMLMADKRSNLRLWLGGEGKVSS